MKALNDWLKMVRADGLVLVRTRVAGDWGFTAPQREAVVFHFVAEGRAFVRGSTGHAFELQAGELVLLPRGDAHALTHSLNGAAPSLSDFIAKRNGIIDTADKASTLVCGEFAMDKHLALPALLALPPTVHLNAAGRSGSSPVADTLRLLRAELESSNFGNHIVVRNLLSTLFVYFIREWVQASASDSNDWFKALRSPQIALALSSMHEAPERDWSLEELAERAGLSRATFARQFRETVGEPPHNYLTRWRMGVAAQLLEETDLRLAEIASRVGYSSEFSFSRAFKQARGVAPVRFRASATQ